MTKQPKAEQEQKKEDPAKKVADEIVNAFN